MSNKIRTASAKEKIRAAKRPERLIEVCLRGDLVAEIQRVNNELADLQRDAADDSRFIGDPRSRELAEQIELLRQEMRDSTIGFLIRAMSTRGWNDMRAKHPPRDNDDRDKIAGGVNVDTFNAEALRTSIISPELDDDDWDELMDALTDKQYEDILDTMWSLNRGSVDVPFSSTASRILNSDSRPRRRSDSGSRSNGSTAGNPAA